MISMISLFKKKKKKVFLTCLAEWKRKVDYMKFYPCSECFFLFVCLIFCFNLF